MERIVTNWGRHHSKGCRFQNPFIARVIIDTREKGTGEQPVEGLSTFGKNSLTSTGTKEAVRWVRQKSIGLQPKRPSARTCWLQELNSDQTTGCIAEQGSGGVAFGEIGCISNAHALLRWSFKEYRSSGVHESVCRISSEMLYPVLPIFLTQT